MEECMVRWLNKSVFILIGGVITIAVEGIIGNRADVLFVEGASWIPSSVNQNAIPWIALGLFLMLSAVESFCLLQHIKLLKLALRRTRKMVELDSSLLRVLASWIPTTRRDQEAKRILREVLHDATTEFDDSTYRAAVLLPDATGEYLTCWASYEMPQDSIENMQFYIGNNGQTKAEKGGVAGEAYMEEKIIIGHVEKMNNVWICTDCKSYRKFNGSRAVSPYKSFANVPILALDPLARNTPRCLGVVCFDSPQERIFDSKEMEGILFRIASRVAAAILIWQKLP
jgi:hypothetical protein